MDINFHDPSDIPLPPEEVRIRELRVEPLPDGRRVRIFTELTPFQQKPNLEIKIMTEAGSEAATLSIIEAIDYKMQFTVHLKDAQSPATYDHVWFWRKWLGDRKGQACRIIACGRMNSAWVEFEDGYQVITNRYSVRKAKPQIGKVAR